MILKVKRRPTIQEAMQWRGDNLEQIKNWAGDSVIKGFNSTLIIKTLEGRMLCELDDYIIKGIKGEFYVCKPDIFKEIYEVIE